ncbi:MAG: flagellar hook-associated protein FlgK [Nitrospirae bacterium]|nr:flagellar hook-associated protein FlgK [Nitrospirota bacterium]
MSSISNIFNIGVSALLANQNALAITSNNIANVNTPGYSKETAFFNETTPVNGNPGQIGTGVQIAQIQRMVNQFLNNQVTQEQSSLGQYDIMQSTLSNVQSFFSDSQGTGINQALSDFFNAFQDVSNNPQSLPARQALIQKGNILSQIFSNTSANLTQIENNLNSQISGAINDANALAGEIAGLNGQIARAQLSGQSPNALLDQRDQYLNQLASKLNISTFVDASGQVTVMVGGGNPLVEGNTAHSLTGVANPDNSGYFDVAYAPANGTPITLNGSITGGNIKGLLDLRDTTVSGDLTQLDILAAGIINEVNQQHQAGYGLDGTTGNLFFSPLLPNATALSTNAGTAVVTASVVTPASLTFNPYQLTFSGGNYTLTNTVSGASTSAAYGGATTVTFEGFQIAIGAGAANGDIFNLSETQGVSVSMTVSLTDPNKVAAASALAGLPGDNGNALFLSGISGKAITAFAGETVQGYYSNLTGTIGLQAQSAQRNFSAEKILKGQLFSQQQEVSGVSLDEEMSNLINFQNAYAASAKLITMADEIFQTLIAMKH